MHFFSKLKNRIINHEHVIFHWDKAKSINTLSLPTNYSIVELNQDNQSDIDAWCKVIGESFNRECNHQTFENSIVAHNRYNVVKTYKLMFGEKTIGVVSGAINKLNPAVGTTHYLGLVKQHRGKGLGKYLIFKIMCFFLDHQHEIKSLEGESKLKHKKSLFIHFDLGFVPKLRQQDWNVIAYNGVFGQLTKAIFVFYYLQWKMKNSQRK